MAEVTKRSDTSLADWPTLRVAEWTDTRDARGLTTSAIPHGQRLFDIEFDFCDHRLRIRHSSGAQRLVALAPKPVAQFYAETTAALWDLGLDVAIRTTPVEVERAIPFEDDHEDAAYDPDAAHLFWRQLLQAHRVLSESRSRFIGKVSPVHFFWGGFDMAVTRFSGRTAPTHPGGASNVGDWVMVEPDGFRDHPIRPDAGYYSSEASQFLLPYEVVHPAPDPDHTLLEFLQTTYEAAADHGGWDRDALEDDPGAASRSTVT